MSVRTIGVCAMLLSAACAPTVRSAAREASSAAVEESVEEATSPENQRQLAQASQSPRVEQATENLSKEVADGIVRSLDSPETRKKLVSVTTAAAVSAARELIRLAGSEDARQAMLGLTGAVTDHALGQLATRMQSDLGPALQQTLEQNVAPGLAATLSDEQLQRALGRTSQVAAHGAFLGVNEGVEGVWPNQSMLSLSHGLRGWLWFMLLSCGLLAFSLLCGAIIAIARSRRTRSEVLRLESAALLLATAMREKRASQESDEILAVVRDSLENSARRDHAGLFGALRLHRRRSSPELRS